MSSYYLTLNPFKTEILLAGLRQQISKIVNPSLSIPSTRPIMPSLSAKNFGFIFDSTLSFFKQISSLSSACHSHIHDLRRILHTLDFTTTSTIATSLIDSHLDYCNSLYYGVPITQIKRLQYIQNGLAHAITRTSRHFHITPIFKSLHWLKVESGDESTGMKTVTRWRCSIVLTILRFLLLWPTIRPVVLCSGIETIENFNHRCCQHPFLVSAPRNSIVNGDLATRTPGSWTTPEDQATRTLVSWATEDLLLPENHTTRTLRILRHPGSCNQDAVELSDWGFHTTLGFRNQDTEDPMTKPGIPQPGRRESRDTRDSGNQSNVEPNDQGSRTTRGFHVTEERVVFPVDASLTI